jgi:hypothetical protein
MSWFFQPLLSATAQLAAPSAPTLTSQTVGSISTSGGTPAVTTDQGDGTIYMVVVPSGDSPSVTQIKAGQRSSGAAAIANQNQAVSATGVQTFSAVTGLTSNTSFAVWFVHTNAGALNSTAVLANFSTLFSFNDARQAIINGLDSAQAEGTGWDAVVKAGIPVSAVVRTSSTVVTITLPAFATYNITADETITATIPATAVVGAAAITATPTFSVSAIVAAIARAVVRTVMQAVRRASYY